jgi:hypothetical protein
MNHAVGFALILAGAWFVFRGPTCLVTGGEAYRGVKRTGDRP